MSKKKPKVVTRTIYRNISDDDSKFKTRLKGEIEELESKRGKLGKGVGNFFAKLSVNKQISEKRKMLNQGDKIKLLKAQTEFGRALLEKEKVKAELKGLRQKSQVNFDDLYKSGNNNNNSNVFNY